MTEKLHIKFTRDQNHNRFSVGFCNIISFVQPIHAGLPSILSNFAGYVKRLDSFSVLSGWLPLLEFHASASSHIFPGL